MSRRAAREFKPLPESRRGPYVTVAAFCREARKEPNGGLTLVGITQEAYLPEDQFVDGTAELEVVMAIQLAAGGFVGTKVLEVEFSGIEERKPMPAEFLTPSAFSNFVGPVRLEVRADEPIWIDLFLEGRWLTRMPFVVRRARHAPAPTVPPDAPTVH